MAVLGYTGEPAPSGFNLTAHVVGRAAASHPDRTALLVVTDAAAPREQAEHWSFAELDEAVRRVAAGLRGLGLERGDRVMIRLGNTSDYALLHFGAIAAGLVSLPSSAQLTAPEARFLLADSGARAIAVDGALDLELPTGVQRITPREVARWRAGAGTAAYAMTPADDPAFLVYTSGTTGRPKGVLHAQRSAWGRRPMYAAWLGLREGDRLLHAGAFNWTYTLGVGLTDPWANAATALIYNGPRDPGVWARLVEAYRATIFAAVPGIYRQLLASPGFATADLASLRYGVTAGEALAPRLLEEWRARTGLELYEALGMSEISTFISSGPRTPVREGSPGRAQPGRCVAVLPAESGTDPLPPGEVGLLAVHESDPGLMLGYWNRPEEEAAVRRGPWFVGGDLVSIGTDGYVTFRGRADDLMNPLGYRVSPVEVEQCLAGHPSVADVAVTDVEVRPGVRIVVAFVVARAGAGRDSAALLSYAAHHLAAYKCPREVVWVEALPRTANGKLRRRALSLRP
ncbi:MAG: AMP-binding protein [Intrasporangium sp.]|uniref:acyl-CoA synthetase n=1 Tax=Intrasporangium sp. TaxID=1925024 RepID=UPI002647D1C0|nr:AMP-binding protein [Intrasporangium sp.]MDN5796227.1 AMP-binding protein [Intrasporangium sp.]